MDKKVALNSVRSYQPIKDKDNKNNNNIEDKQPLQYFKLTKIVINNLSCANAKFEQILIDIKDGKYQDSKIQFNGHDMNREEFDKIIDGIKSGNYKTCELTFINYTFTNFDPDNKTLHLKDICGAVTYNKQNTVSQVKSLTIKNCTFDSTEAEEPLRQLKIHNSKKVNCFYFPPREIIFSNDITQ